MVTATIGKLIKRARKTCTHLRFYFWYVLKVGSNCCNHGNRFGYFGASAYQSNGLEWWGMVALLWNGAALGLRE